MGLGGRGKDEANFLHAELACTQNDQHRVNTAKEKAFGEGSRPLANDRGWDSSRTSRGACSWSLGDGLDASIAASHTCMQGFNDDFNACDFIMRVRYP